MKSLQIILIVLGVAVLAGLFLAVSYNRFVSLNEKVENKWAQVETQYQRRYDLVPNLVESVKGLMAQEKDVFLGIAEARKAYAGARTLEEKVEATNQMESALARLLVIMENYPDLKSSEAVQTLMAQLEGTENRISVERKRYNDAVAEFNMAIKRFPGNTIAGLFGFKEKPYFEAVSGAEAAPQVKF